MAGAAYSLASNSSSLIRLSDELAGMEHVAREAAVANEEASTVVSKRDGWYVIHPTLLDYAAVCFILLFGGGGAASIAAGTAVLVTEGNGGAFAALLCLGFGLFCFPIHLFRYYVAFDQHRLAQGYSLRRPKVLIPRSEISHLTGKYLGRAYCGRVIGVNGRVLLAISNSITRRQIQRLAEQLGVEYRP
jgi:hypothetical protein